MKVLVSTVETQGQRKNDYSWVPEGELLRTGGSECDREAIDGRCGCRRAFVGTATSAATTTAKVVDVAEIDREAVAQIVHDSLERDGWFEGSEPKLVESWVEEETKSIVEVAETFEPGTIIERRGSTYQERRVT